LFAAFVLCASAARADDIEYAYDELGRLVQASNRTSGEAVLYTYDAVGNITSQTTRPLTTLSIGHFTPNHGPVGTQVTVHGTGFSATPASNLVRFNGTAATVQSASQTQIVATVPSAATSGAISVDVGGVTATSGTPFTITATGDGPTITALLPPAAPAGSSISIVGTNFELVPAQNRVRLNNSSLQVLGSTATSINVLVPPNVGSGRVRVTTPRGVAVSPTDFIVVPPFYAAANIASTERIESDGTATTLTFTAPWKFGLRLFDGNAGDLLTVGVSSMSLPVCTLRVYAPDGTQLVSGSITASGQGLQLPKLPTTGTYAIVVDPASNTGSIALGVFEPVQAALTLNGAATSVNLSPPGRRALLTFDGTQGTYASISVGSVAFSGTVSVISPTGAVLSSATLNASGTVVQPLLPRTGTYSVLLDPTGSVGGTAAVSVAQSATPSLVANSGPHAINLSNQTPVNRTFRGEVGQYMSIVVGLQSSTSFAVSVSVRNPDGSPLTNITVGTSPQGSTWRGSRILNFGPLASAGTYTAVVQQTTSVTGTAGLTLTSASTGTLTANSPAGATISVAGQSVLRSFVGSAGQFLSFAVAEAQGGISGAKITVLRPDGSVLATGDFTPPLARCLVFGGDPIYRCGRAVVNMGPLLVTGSYQVLLQQVDSTRIEDDYTGGLSLVLSTPVSGTLVADGAGEEPTAQLLGQGMKYSFAGTQGQYLSLGLVSTAPFSEGVVSNPAIGVVLDPDGATIATGALVVTRRGGTGGGSVVWWFGSGVVNMGPLPVSGTYTFLLLQSGQALNDVSSASLGLSTPLAGSFTTSNPSVSRDVQRAGQGLLYSFPCSAGEYVSGAVATESSNITAASITVLGADGAPLASRDMTATPVSQPAAGSYKGSTVVNAGPLSGSGTCALLAQQTGSGETNTGQLSLRWSLPLTGALGLNTLTGVEVENSGQGLLYSFDANAGDYRAITVSVADYVKSATVSVLGPSGSVVATTNLSTVEMPGSLANPPTYEGAALLNLGPLSATGTYKLLVQQTGSGSLQSGGVGVVLSAPVPGSLAVGGSADAPLALRGQGARYTFSGSTGQHLSLRVSESSSQIASASVKILDPAGNVLKSGTLAATKQTCSGCNGYSGNVTVDSGLLPLTGTYSVLVQQASLPPFDNERTTPYVGGVGTLTLELTELQPGTGSTTNISTTVPGQAASVTFPAVAGQSVSVALSNPVLSPSSQALYFIYVYAPDGSNVGSVSCWNTWAACDVMHLRQLPQTGTYRVDVVPSAGRTISGTLTISSALTGALTPGAPLATDLSQVGQAAHISFTATAGQTFALALSSLSSVPANSRVYVDVLNAAGALVVSGGSTTTSNLTMNLASLPAGTYYAWIRPQYPSTSTMQVTLHPRVGGTVAADGTSSNFSTHAPGQIAYYDFSATAGDTVSVALSNQVLSPSSQALYFIYVYAPDGSQVGYVSCWSTWTACDVIHLRNLPQTGSYRVLITPPATHMMSGTLTVSAAQTGTLSPSIPASANLSTVGQAAQFSFTATAGQTFAVSLSSLSSVPANTRVYMDVLNAAGALAVSGSSTTTSNLTMNLPYLPADTYYVWIRPQYPSTSTMQVTLHPRVGSAIPTDGTPSTFSTAAPGQTAYYDFSATAGQNVSVAVTGMVVSPATPLLYFINVYAPNGSGVGSLGCWSTAPCAVVHMRNLPQTGTYRVQVSAAATHTFSGTLTVSAAQTGSLSPGVPLDLNLNAIGQAANLSFTATAGQTVSVNMGQLSTSPAGMRMLVQVFNAAGTYFDGIYSAVGSSLVFPNLATGTYYAWVGPEYPSTSTLQMTLRPAVAVATDGTPTSVDTLQRGQSSFFTFSATAGQSTSVALSNVVTSPSGSAALYFINVYAPNGGNVGSLGCWNTAPCAVVHMRNLSQTGTYRVQISPPPTHTLTGTLTVSAAQTGSLSPGVPLDLNLNAIGQAANLSFTATAGQTVSVNMGQLSTSPAGMRMLVQVFNAAGTYFDGIYSAVGSSLVFPNLATGTYYAWIAPEYPSTSTLQMTLRPAVAVATDGTPTSVDTLQLGQSAFFNFSATAGQNVSVALSNVVTSPSGSAALYFINVYAPNGGNVGSLGCWNTAPCAVVHMRNLSQTGTYRVQISPPPTHTLTGTLTLTQGLSGTLSSGVPVNLTLPLLGQTMMFDMTLPSAQPVSVTATSISTTPAGTQMVIYVLNAAGNSIASGSGTTGITINLGTLAAGSYKVWVIPQYPATSSMVVGY